MQASVHRFDPESGSGSVLRDDGLEVPFTGAVFDASGLRQVRPGQRVSIEAKGGAVTRLWIVGITTDNRLG